MRPTRRSVVAASAGLAALGAGGVALARRQPIPGELGGADFSRGHLLRGALPAPTVERAARVVVVGGGVAGLSAAWTLAEAGMRDVVLLELEDTTGGNARSGANAVSAYPLGAHYLPIPNAESVAVHRLLERLGIITGWTGGRPVFDPYAIVADPDERLLHLGRWQEGLVPTLGLAPRDRDDLAGFFAAMARFRAMRGHDGRPAFAIPMALSSRDPALLALDRTSFADWIAAQGWRSPVLAAHLRYCCRDDYGTEPHEVSAWAGIHYFAGRRGVAANTDGDNVLTWPEGNGRLVRAMAARVRPAIRGGRVAARVGADGAVDAYDVAARRTVRWRADAVILATPRFVTARLVEGASDDGFGYAPWVVANVTVDRLPAGAGAQIAWDNVSWTSASLGYVVATHQSLGTGAGPSVLTWYLPLSDMPPAEARRLLLARPLPEWQAIVADDLLAANPDLRGAIRRIDVWRWGHAMIRPAPGFIWGGAREAAGRPRPPLFFAHSDLSGLSIFEEAHDRGTRAAEAAMALLGHPHALLPAA